MYKRQVFYVTDPVQQSQYINMFKEAGKNAVILSHNIDTAFISHLEQRDQTLQFKRIDADLTEELKGGDAADVYKRQALSVVLSSGIMKSCLKLRTVMNRKNQE